MTFAVIDAHAAYDCAQRLQAARIIPEMAGLRRASGRVIPRVKVKHQPFAPEFAQTARLPILIGKLERGSLVADGGKIAFCGSGHSPQHHGEGDHEESQEPLEHANFRNSLLNRQEQHTSSIWVILPPSSFIPDDFSPLG